MSNDTQLKQAVLDELKWEPSVDAADIGVTVKDGVVTLMGHVGNYAEKHAAEKAALRIKDVKGVAEEIDVNLPFSVKQDDAEIVEAVINRLAWNVSIPRDAVKASVSKGWVTLTGQVEWHYQHDAAADAVRHVWGVTGVSNQISIKSKANAGDIKSSILTALNRSWFRPEHIDVAASDGKITLSGNVKNWSERALAGTTAWAAPGVTSVVNEIRVH